MGQTSVLDIKGYDEKSPYAVDEPVTVAAEDQEEFMSFLFA